MLGIYGNTAISTPNIDQLAANDIVFGLSDIQIDGAAGRSHARSFNEDTELIDQPVFFEFVTYRSIRTTKWKFVRRFAERTSEFYRIYDNPAELINLADNPSFGDLVSK